MANQRRMFQTLAVIGLLAAIFMLLRDGRYEDINCGSALLPTDLTELSLDSGDAAADNFVVEVYNAECAQSVTRRRFAVALLLLASAGAYSAARVLERRKRIPGDPVV